MSHRLYEFEAEQIALELLRDENGYAVLYGPDISISVSRGEKIAKEKKLDLNEVMKLYILSARFTL
jgi:hypothetical protein